MRREGREITIEIICLQGRIAICVSCMRDCHAIVLFPILCALSIVRECVRARACVWICLCAHIRIHTYAVDLSCCARCTCHLNS